MTKLKNAFSAVRSTKITPKGNAGYDNARENIDPHVKTKVINSKEAITGRQRIGATWHTYGGFQDQTELLAIGVATWTFVTNATNTLWTGLEADGLTLVNDQMIITNTGDYAGTLSITFQGGNGKDYIFRVYNVTQSTVAGYHIGVSGLGVGNFTNASIPLYLEANAGDVYEFQVYTADGTDATFINAIFYLNYVHD